MFEILCCNDKCHGIMFVALTSSSGKRHRGMRGRLGKTLTNDNAILPTQDYRIGDLLNQTRFS